MNNNELQGKVALVTGGGTGLGYGAAKRLSEAGAFVYIVGRRLEVLEKAALQLGENVKALQGDVSKKSDLEVIANTIKTNHQHLDIIFANAGFCKEAALEDISEDFFDTMINVNLKGTLFTVQTMLPILNDNSSIILTSSMTALIGLRRYTVYAATKAAIIAMAKCWVSDLKDRKIRVNVISPGTVPTEGSMSSMNDQQIAEFKQTISSQVPLGRVGNANEIGDAVVFLASNKSSYINGVNLTVDGGQTQVYAGEL